MILEFYAVSDPGSVRAMNEDNYFISCGAARDLAEPRSSIGGKMDPVFGAFVVCDGMGGEACGDQAARAAIQSLKMEPSETIEESGIRNTNAANRAVLDVQRTYGCDRAGCTIAALEFRDGVCQSYNVGDSRVYCLRGGILSKMSYDHSAVQQLVELGIITEEEADRHPDRSNLTQAIGMELHNTVLRPAFSQTVEICDGDRFIICSDGLYEQLPAAKIRELLAGDGSSEELGNSLLQAAIDSGSTDNITVIVIKVNQADQERMGRQ